MESCNSSRLPAAVIDTSLAWQQGLKPSAVLILAEPKRKYGSPHSENTSLPRADKLAMLQGRWC